MKDYPNLSNFLLKHKLAQANNSKEIRFGMQELNDAVHDIHLLIANASVKVDDQSELKDLLKKLLDELKDLSEDVGDGGTF